MPSIIEKYRLSGNLVGRWVFRKNTLLDDSGNGYNAASTAGASVWKQTDKGNGVSCPNPGDRILVADAGAAPKLQTTELTGYWFGEKIYRFTSGGIRLLSKRNAGSSDFEVIATAANLIIYANGTTSTLSTTAVKGARFIAWQMPSSGVPKFWVDGAYIGSGDTSITKVGTTADLLINCYYNTGSNGNNPNAVLECGMINTASVTNQEISQLYESLMSEKGITNQQINTTIPFPKLPNEIFSTDCVIRDGYMTDFSGNVGNNSGYLGSGSIDMRNEGPFGLDAHFNARPARWDGVNWDFTNTPMTVHVFFKETVQANNQGIINQYASATNKGWVIRHATTGAYNALLEVSGDTAVSQTFGAIQNGTWNLLTITKPTGASVSWKVYLNGAYVGETGVVNNVPNVAYLTIGDRRNAATSSLTNDSIAMVKIQNVEASATDISTFYSTFSRWAVNKMVLGGTYPTLAASTGGKIGNTGFTVSNGTWFVEEKYGKKWIDDAALGTCAIRNNLAYGTWVFEFVKEADTSNQVIRFISTLPYYYNTTGQYGYYINVSSTEYLVLFLNNGGTVTSLMQTASAYVSLNTPYKLAVSRDSLGYFTVYIKGGAYTDWQLISVSSGSNPVQNTTYTTSKFVVFEENAAYGNKNRLLGIHPTVLSLQDLKVLYP